MPHLCVWHDSFLCVWHDSFVRVTWLVCMCVTWLIHMGLTLPRLENATMGWLRVVGSLKLQVSFAKKPSKRDDILQKRPIIVRSLRIVATPCLWDQVSDIWDVARMWMSRATHMWINVCVTWLEAPVTRLIHICDMTRACGTWLMAGSTANCIWSVISSFSNSQSIIKFSRSLLPRSVEKRPRRLRLEIEI